MNIWRSISSQFGNPHGRWGKLAGLIMTYRTSNIERNIWAVDLLNIHFNDAVLELGYGPGIALTMISKNVSTGIIYGIDHSRIMYELASKRNRAVIDSGRMKLFLGPVSDLPAEIQRIDKVLDVNSFQFWKDPLHSLVSIRLRMNTGGSIAIVHQPRKPGSHEMDADDMGNTISLFLKQAGFHDLSLTKRIMKPVAAVCVMGTA